MQHPGPIQMLERRAQFAGMSYAGRSGGGFLYAVELSSGLVKIGLTRNPRARLESLATYVKRVLGARIARYHVGADIGAQAAFMAERVALQAAIQDGALPAAEMGECFTGLAFERAVEIVNAASA